MAWTLRALRWAAVAAVGAIAIGGGVLGVANEGASAQTKTDAVVIGDSIMDGHGLPTVSESWPDLVAASSGWSLSDLAADGDGYVRTGDDGTTIADQVATAIALRPSIVILSASSNDLGESDAAVETAIENAVRALRVSLPNAELLAVTPIWNESASPAQLVQFGDDLDAAVLGAGGHYLDIGNPLAGEPQLMQPGDVHPNAAGQQAIATAVESALQRDRLV
jgi:acyl-CoA thioesterase-1